MKPLLPIIIPVSLATALLVSGVWAEYLRRNRKEWNSKFSLFQLEARELKEKIAILETPPAVEAPELVIEKPKRAKKMTPRAKAAK